MYHKPYASLKYLRVGMIKDEMGGFGLYTFDLKFPSGWLAFYLTL